MDRHQSATAKRVTTSLKGFSYSGSLKVKLQTKLRRVDSERKLNAVTPSFQLIATAIRSDRAQ